MKRWKVMFGFNRKIQRKKWFGIKDKCCTDENINQISLKSDYGQCDICKRIFSQ